MQDALQGLSGYKWLVIDMKEVAFMSSMGIGMLVDARSRAAGLKMKVVLSNGDRKTIKIDWPDACCRSIPV